MRTEHDYEKGPHLLNLSLSVFWITILCAYLSVSVDLYNRLEYEELTSNKIMVNMVSDKLGFHRSHRHVTH